MTIQISPEKLAEFESLFLHSGSHGDFDEGHCAMEVVSWLADEGFTDAPACASPVLRRYTIRLNDRWDDHRRQTLKPYLLRMIGTGGDGKDELREKIAMRALFTDLLAPWYRLAGLDEEADQMAALVDAPRDEQRAALYRFRDAAWAARKASLDIIRQKVRERLAEKPAADADAVAAAAADAVADAVADAAAAAAAAAAADAAAAAIGESTYSAAYRAARRYFDEHPPEISGQIAELAAAQQPVALELLDRMIDPAEDAS